jgi:hypothetical protein
MATVTDRSALDHWQQENAKAPLGEQRPHRTRNAATIQEGTV